MERSDTADTWLDMPPAPSQTRWALAVTAIVLVVLLYSLLGTY